MKGPCNEEPALLGRAGAGDEQALAELFGRHRDRLRRMIQLRLDRRLQGRLDPSDVLQEAYLEVSRCLGDYLRDPALPFFLWLRLLTSRKLLALHRYHLGTRRRDATRERSLGQSGLSASSESLAGQLLGRLPTPSEAAVRAELDRCVREALERMEPIDREVLALRHFEQLTNREAAQVLGLSEAAASNRYVRALTRLREVLAAVPGLADQGLTP